MRIETDGYCAICGDDFVYERGLNAKSRVLHHLAWEPEEITMPVCIPCHRKIHSDDVFKEYRPAFEPPLEARIKMYDRNWKREHRERCCEYSLKYARTHSDAVHAKNKEWHLSHPDYSSMKSREWRETHIVDPEEKRVQDAEYRRKNLEQLRAYDRTPERLASKREWKKKHGYGGRGA